MKTFIIIVMMCHLDYKGQEVCIPMVENPKIYYKTEKECNEVAVEKRKSMQKSAIENNILITGLYSTCIQEPSI